MNSIATLIEKISSAVWGWPMIILLLGTHVFMTIRLRFPQLKVGKAIRLSLTKDSQSHGDVSQFGALATALAATIGTGNIVGVATAVALGGPGAVLWCWITGVFGMATKYSEGLLAVKYRVKTKDGRMLGGPMFALERGLHAKWLAILFAAFTAIAAFGIGNTVQANSISLLLNETYGISQVLVGVILALLVLLVVVFGVKGGSKEARAFADALNGEIFSLLANVGDAKSLVIHPASTTHSQLSDEDLRKGGVLPELIRLSIGLEHVDDITAELDRALGAF